jgi:hypothetical protein
MKDVASLLTDIWRTYSSGMRNRDKTVLGFVAVVVISIVLIVVGLIKL